MKYMQVLKLTPPMHNDTKIDRQIFIDINLQLEVQLIVVYLVTPRSLRTSRRHW